MSRQLRMFKEGDARLICDAIRLIREARQKLRAARADRAASYAQRALKSAQGAWRHSDRMLWRAVAEGRVTP